MLPNAHAVETVYLHPETGILAGVRARALDASKEVVVMECDTIKSNTKLTI
jgi:3-hydroxyisobutyrate dehydrogenase